MNTNVHADVLQTLAEDHQWRHCGRYRCHVRVPAGPGQDAPAEPESRTERREDVQIDVSNRNLIVLVQCPAVVVHCCIVHNIYVCRLIRHANLFSVASAHSRRCRDKFTRDACTLLWLCLRL